MSIEKKKTLPQFRHYHDLERGFCDVFSEGCTQEDKKLLTAIASSLWREDDSCFTYLPKDGRAYIVQTTKTTDMFAHGLVLREGDLDEEGYAVDYIGRLEKDAIGRETQELELGCLPRVGAPAFSRAATLRAVFPRIVDALVYTDKPLVLTGATAEELTLYVTLALHMLPARFARKIGFSVTAGAMPLFFGNPEHDIGSSLRLLATDAKVGTSARWNVIDIASATPADDAGLRPYARAIDALGGYLTTGGEGRIRALVNSVRDAFLPDGSVRLDLLDKLLLVSEFENGATPDTARALLTLAKEDREGIIPQQSAVGAAYCLLALKSITPEDEALIGEVRAKDSEISAMLSARVGRHAFSKLLHGKSLSEEEERDVHAFLADKDDGELAPDGEFASKLMSTSRRSLAMFATLSRMWLDTGRDAFALLAMRYVHILDTFNYRELTKQDYDAALLECAASFGEDAEDIYGIAMLSCYLPTVTRSRANRATTETRIATLVNRLRTVDRASEPLYRGITVNRESGIETVRAAADTLELVRALLRVKASVQLAANRLGEEISAVDDFKLLFDSQLDALVSGFSFAECLVLFTDEDTPTDSYGALQNALKVRLINVADVKSQIKKAGELLDLYRQFMEEHADLFPEGDEIAAYISFLVRSNMLGLRVAEYRRAFVIGSYNSLSLSRRTEVAKHAERRTGNRYEVGAESDGIRAILTDPAASYAEKQELTESIIDATRAPDKKKGGGGNGKDTRYLVYAYIVSMLYMLTSAVLLFLPPFLASRLLGHSLADRLALYFTTAHVGVILGIGVFNLGAYFICWLASKHDRRASLRRAACLTLLLLFIPTLAYVLGYVLTYFLL